MPIEKTTSVSLPSTNGKFTFQRVGDDLEFQAIDGGGVTNDSAMLSADDLRFLLKEYFPTARKPRGPNAVKKQNGKGKGQSASVNA